MQSPLVEFEFDPIKSEVNRSKHGIIRIISVRRARDNEKELYERNKC
jgi:uncharacterized DUF497 family protein